MKTFEQELRNLINKYSKENDSGTPDYILAEYLCMCLAAFNYVVRAKADIDCSNIKNIFWTKEELSIKGKLIADFQKTDKNIKK